MIQLALAFFGLAALYMATGNNARARRWAPLVALSLAYSAVYVRGAWVQWRQP